MLRSHARLVLLGSTGSIGTQTLDVVERLRKAGHPFRVVSLAAGSNVEALAEQICAHSPEAACIASSDDAARLRERFPRLRVVHGPDGLTDLAGLEDVDLVINALVGAVGLAPTLAALRKGRTVALANKESLVVGGALVKQALAGHGGALFPLDSEHNALYQCLEAGKRSDIARLVVTASGGPFLRFTDEALARVTPEQALKHPNWSMGSRITIDSATMVNKAFEVIEAHVLFGVPYEKIDVLVHPPSIVHSMVEYNDGSVLAQLATHDMRIPIQYALTYPDRPDTQLPRLNLDSGLTLPFETLDVSRFPAFATVLQAADFGGSALAAVNAADEILISRFLAGEIPFTGISSGLRRMLDAWSEATPAGEQVTLERLLDVDRWARALAAEISV